MSLKKRLAFVFCGLIIISLVCLSIINKPEKKIDKILASKAYSYLPVEAKEYVKEVYEQTGEIIHTEKNKEDNIPYLNPKYIEYLELSDQVKSQVTVIPDTYVVDLTTTNTYENVDLPSRYDLRDVDGNNYVSPIKNQGSTGICWAFSTIENVETYLMSQSEQSYSSSTPKFSVRQMDYVTSTNYLVRDASWISCSGNCTYYPWSNPENGCHELGEGGNFYASSIAMANAITLTDESVLPWTETKTAKWPKDIMGYDKSLYEVNETSIIPSINSDTATQELLDSYIDLVKLSMILYGGPYVGTYSPQSTCGFTNTDGTKAIKVDDCANAYANQGAGHAMQIIGWDDDYEYYYCDAGANHYSVSNNKCSSGTLKYGRGAWILRNSWGTDTAETRAYSYVYLTFDSTRLSVGFVTDVTPMATRNWDNNYHKNPWINSDISQGMAIVTSQTESFNTHNTKPEKIEKIKFFNASGFSDYTLSITSGDNVYSDVASFSVPSVGIFTVDLSDQNIVINNNEFSVSLSSTNNGKLYKGSISVFTSNVDEDKMVVSYSEDGYDSQVPLSNENPLYEDLYYNSYSTKYSYNISITSYLKNIPQYANLSYRLRNGDKVTSYFGESNIHYEGDIAIASFNATLDNNISFQAGETWIMEIVYNDEVVNSLPVKFYHNNKKTKSAVRLYANNGTDYYVDAQAYDKVNNKFDEVNNDPNFYNDGYAIDSWNTLPDGSGESFDINNVQVYSDTTLYAQWSNDKVKVEVDYHCSSCNNSNQFFRYTYELDDILEAPINTFENDGYKFVSWKYSYINGSTYTFAALYEQETGVSFRDYNIYTYPVYNIHIDANATWKSEYNTVSFDANGGQGNMLPIYNKGHIRLKGNLFTNEGYHFVGWNTEPDGTGVLYTDYQYIDLDEDITLYAQWSLEDYRIVFWANNDTGGSNLQFASHNVATPLMKNMFTRTGYNFIGWNTSSDGSGTSYDDEQTVYLTGNLTLYAQWEIIKYPVTYDANGGTGAPDSEEKTYGTDYIISSVIPTRVGYTFTTWNTSPDSLNNTYAPGAVYQSNSPLALYAIWNANNYIIEYNSNGGIGFMGSTYLVYDEESQLATNAYTRTGYTFAGWNTSPDGSGTPYSDEQHIINLTSVNNEIITLYAQWEINTYSITFNANGAQGSMLPQVVNYNTPTKLNGNTYTNEGLNFVGWNTLPDGTGIHYSNEQTVSLTDNLVLYAQWAEREPVIINEYVVDDDLVINAVNVNTQVSDFIEHFDLLDGYTVESETKTINNQEVLYTGAKVTIYKNSEVFKEYTVSVLGDASGDGKINYLDYVSVYNHIQKVKHPELNKTLLIGEYLKAADMSGDNKITYLDYVRIYNKIKELKGV